MYIFYKSLVHILTCFMYKAAISPEDVMNKLTREYLTSKSLHSRNLTGFDVLFMQLSALQRYKSCTRENLLRPQISIRIYEYI
jgi:hypothetical protein